MTDTSPNGIPYTPVPPAPDDEIPQRFERAEQVFPNKLWREQLREWDEEVKPRSIATHREIQAVDPAARAGGARPRGLLPQHMPSPGGARVPAGVLLVPGRQWAGPPPAALLVLMRGAAPV